MKILILILTLTALTSCSFFDEDEEQSPCESNLDECVLIDTPWSLKTLDEQCSKLAACMKMPYEILSFINQKHNPYACRIYKQEKDYTKSHYFYPKAELIFGEARFERLEDAIATCEMMTGTGDKSKEYYDKLQALFKKMDEDRKRQKLQESELNIPKLEPAVKVRVVE